MEISLMFRMPETAAGKQALAELSAQVHAQGVLQQIDRLPCSLAQKQVLVDAILHETKAGE